MKMVQERNQVKAIAIAAEIQPAAIVVAAPVFPWYFEPGTQTAPQT